MNMLIDPDREGCTLWWNGMVCHIKGAPMECVERIVEFFYIKGISLTNDCTLSLDISGVGMYYADRFNDLGIRYGEFKGSQFI